MSDIDTTGCHEHPDGSISIDLCVPIERERERITAIRLRRPTAAQIAQLNLERIKSGHQDGLIEFIHAVSDLTLKEVRGLDGADFLFVTAHALRVFLQRRAVQLA